ncbi:MAG: GIY-YIG nuclease family protein [Hydrogenophaga sp.]|nr:GIY-YIG nuclease family protein [Hydrogenophaga sp.]
MPSLPWGSTPCVRARESGHVLVGSSRNVHASLNRVRFELRMGSHKDRVLQAEWKRGGEAALSFEILEMVKERDDPDFDYAAELRGLEQIHRQLQGLAA